MDEDRRNQIASELELRETKNLVELWQDFNPAEWEEGVFDLLSGILLTRLGELPPQSIQVQLSSRIRSIERFIQSGQLDQALIESNLAIQLAPEMSTLYNNRGVIYTQMGRLEPAIADFQAALAFNPEFKDAWLNLKKVEKEITTDFLLSPAKIQLDRALTFTLDGDYESALVECDSAKKILPGIAVAWNTLGMIFQELGVLEEAIEAYLEAIRLNPRFLPARENLGNARKAFEAQQFHLAALVDDKDVQDESVNLLRASLDVTEESETSGNEELAPEWLYLDEKAFLLAGWPGHRTRRGRFGLDPLDTDFEQAHMEGLIIRWLWTRKFRTHNPFYLLVMILLGVLGCMPLLFNGFILVSEGWISFSMMFLMSPYWLGGLALLTNVFLSFTSTQPEESIQRGDSFF